MRVYDVLGSFSFSYTVSKTKHALLAICKNYVENQPTTQSCMKGE